MGLIQANINSTMVEQQSRRVEDAMKKIVNEIDTEYLRKMQVIRFQKNYMFSLSLLKPNLYSFFL